jgi:hypothetical protein
MQLRSHQIFSSPIPFEQRFNFHLPLFGTAVEAGFPSPADDHLERPLDLNEELVRHPSATFFIRAKGESMRDAGIHDGALLVIDRSITPSDGQIVGDAGVKVADLAKTLKVKGTNLHVWFATTGKKNPGIKKAGKGHYKLAGK